MGCGPGWASLPLVASEPPRKPWPHLRFLSSLLFLSNCSKSLRALQHLVPMGSETLSGLNKFFPELLDCICFSIPAGGEIRRGSLHVMQKTVFYCLLYSCCFGSFIVLFCFCFFVLFGFSSQFIATCA